jgi:hypothetical protein
MIRELWVGYWIGLGVMGVNVCLATVIGLSVPVIVLVTVGLAPFGIWVANRMTR